MISYLEKKYGDDEIFEKLHPIVRTWFKNKFKTFSEPQKYAIIPIHNQENVLVSAVTGSGKTLTGFLAILNELIILADDGKLENKVYCIYNSPLRALVNDVYFNLETPLKEMEEIAKKKFNIKIGVRTGDTTATEKQKMLIHTPNILVTTPESLALVITSPKFRDKLRDVKYFIMDEVHSLAENKRGVYLSLSLERLHELAGNFVRIGLSATAEPLEEIAKFVVGNNRECKIAKIDLTKKMDLKVLSPLKDLINTNFEETHNAMYDLINKLIQDHKTTLIFTNTRSATERVVHYLKEKYPKNYTENIGAHHGSLSKEHRLDLEKRMREGKLKAIVCSTSLELGIDIGYIDLVIMLGSPKSIARCTQRCLPYESRILLADGTYKSIGEIVENKLDLEVLSYDKNKGFIKNRINNYHKNNPSNLININLHSGLSLRCTEEHPILTKRGWILARELKFEDEIAELFDFKHGKVPYIYEVIDQKDFYVENRFDFLRKIVDQYVKKNNILYSDFARLIEIKQNHLQNYLRKIGRKKSIRLDLFLKIMDLCKVKKELYLPYLKELKSKSWHRLPLPLKFDSDFMWLSGVVASDGAITKNKRTRELKIKIGNKDHKLLEECQKIFNRFGFYSKILKTKRETYTLECGSKLLAQMMLSLGIKKGREKSYNIEVSNVLNRLPKELVVPYIEGVLEGDGNVNKNIRIFSASKKFMIGLHNLLNRFGIYNHFTKWKAKTSKLIKKINYENIYCLNIGRNEHVKELLKYCTFKGKKSKFLRDQKYGISKNDIEIAKNICWTKIKTIIKEDNNEFVYNITLEKHPNNYFVESVLTHNCGRSGHRLHDTIKGRLIVLDRDDLIESSVMLKNVLERNIDKIHIPQNCLDVLAQQIYGIAISDQIHIDNLLKLIKRSYCYRNLSKEDFMEIVKYLTGHYTTLEDRHVYAKIWYDEETGMIGKKGKLARVIYMTNLGTIPDETFITVKIGEQNIGHLDEGFLERMKRGDVFTLGGQTYEFLFSRGMVAQVKSSAGRAPTIPNWVSEMLPLNFDLALEIGKFRRLMEEKFKNKSKKEILEFIDSYLYLDKNAALAIYNYFNEQFLYLKEIPNDKKLLIEHYTEDNKKYVIFHSLYGRRVNDCLSRALGYAIGKLQHKDVEIGINDNGFFLSYQGNVQVTQAFNLLKSEKLRILLERAIDGSEIFKRRFRHCATRSLMILREYRGIKKRVGRQQVSSMLLMSALKRINENFSILKEAKREVLEDLMDIENTLKVLKQIENDEIKIKEVFTNIPSPFGFNLVLQGYLDILKIEDKIKFLRNMHTLVLAKIGKENQIKFED